MPLENEALSGPTLPFELAVQRSSRGTLPVELNNPIVEHYAAAVSPLAEVSATLVVHKGIFNHFEGSVLDIHQWRTEIDSVVNVRLLKVGGGPQVDDEHTLGGVNVKQRVEMSR